MSKTVLDATHIPRDDPFTELVIHWYRSNKRELPWRQSRNPYQIWISEIMLQQTRVDQMTPYFERFIRRFPDVHALANADLQEVLMLWEGLGYYSRARNMHEAAKTIVREYDGDLPSEREQFRALKGVGDYTAAAVLSIAFNQPYAVVDGNVIRLISRYLGITDDIKKPSVKRYIQDVVNTWISTENPSEFNQGMMEIGSLVCKPRNPSCDSCPLQHTCVAHMTAQTERIPYKSKSSKVPHHTIVVGIVHDTSGNVLIARRPESAMLGGLWEFPGGKVEQGETLEQALERELDEELGITVNNIEAFHQLKHAYSHFKITMHAFTCDIASGKPSPKSSDAIKWVHVHQLKEYPFPKANRSLTQKLAGHKNR
ncbi:MAG: A/G-specific adenine glycosylase [Bacteroidetes bacterium]|nr:A/G-specific adenine glycosylase [Bacteroidota bacterium]MCH8523018.1 A/G-specific adenine glycosylase [Balneolales bacterium]